MSGTTTFSVIIVNWNTCEYLASCLASVHETLPPAVTQVIVVDNASGDGSARMVHDRYPHDQLIANETNRGFSGGVNDGLKVARGEYVLILNPDIVIRPGVVQTLARYLEEYPQVGAIMPLLRNTDGSVQKGYVRKLPSLMQVLLFATVLEPWSRRQPDLVARYLEVPQSERGPAEVEQIPGAFLLTSRKVLEDVGQFDERYRLFFEDVDWCARAREKGWRLVMMPSIEVTHAGGRSFVTDSGNRIQARFFVSMITYFSLRKQKAIAAVAALVLSMNSAAIILKNILLPGWRDAGSRERAALSRRTHWNVIRLLYKAFVLHQDEAPLP